MVRSTINLSSFDYIFYAFVSDLCIKIMNLMEIIQDKPQNMGRYLTEQPSCFHLASIKSPQKVIDR